LPTVADLLDPGRRPALYLDLPLNETVPPLPEPRHSLDPQHPVRPSAFRLGGWVAQGPAHRGEPDEAFADVYALKGAFNETGAGPAVCGPWLHFSVVE